MPSAVLLDLIPLPAEVFQRRFPRLADALEELPLNLPSSSHAPPFQGSEVKPMLEIDDS